MRTVKFFTDAPAAYDGFGTKTLRQVAVSMRSGAGGYPVREVETPADHFRWQVGRYESGGYAHSTGAITYDGWVHLGDWVPLDKLPPPTSNVMADPSFDVLASPACDLCGEPADGGQVTADTILCKDHADRARGI